MRPEQNQFKHPEYRDCALHLYRHKTSEQCPHCVASNGELVRLDAKVQPESVLVGRKDDAGKPEPSLFHQGCANAVAGIVAVLTYGFKKYGKRNGWKEVPEAKLRYKNALYRHLAAFERGELFDNGPDGSGLPNLDMVATNAAFLSELYHADGTYKVNDNARPRLA